jgi:hypothetical protein
VSTCWTSTESSATPGAQPRTSTPAESTPRPHATRRAGPRPPGRMPLQPPPRRRRGEFSAKPPWC